MVFSYQGFITATTQRSRAHMSRMAQSSPSSMERAACLASSVGTLSLWVWETLSHSITKLFNCISQFWWSHHSWHSFEAFIVYWPFPLIPLAWIAGCRSVCAWAAVWRSGEAARDHVCSCTIRWGAGHGLPLNICSWCHAGVWHGHGCQATPPEHFLFLH